MCFKLRRILAASLLLLTSFFLKAQENAELSTNPPGVKWRQVNTPSFRILYAEGFDRQAQRMANTLETIHAPEARTMGGKARKISVVLQNRSAESNGFVTLAPRRSEFYTMSPQDYNSLGNNDWLDLLATHEYRHIVQFQHAARGFNRLVYWLFGNNALLGMASVAAPFWFWEGDAVATETAFTASGRGRIPNFNLAFNSNLNEGRIFDYHKQSLRSYKHFIPNHYVLGYNLVSYVRKRTNDPHIWEKITKRSWSLPFIPFCFSSAVKKETGKYLTDLYQEMAQDLSKEYQKKLEGISISPFTSLTHRKNKTYTNYQYPHEADGLNIISLKSGIGDIEQAVMTSADGEEFVLFTPGPVNKTGMWSYSKRRMAWTEYRYDPRWQARSFSVVTTYDFNTQKIKTLTKKTRYSGASISPDGSKIVTVESNHEYENKIVILDFESGEILRSFAVREGFVSMPAWDSEGKNIIALKTAKSNKNLVSYSLDGEEKIIGEFKTENIGYPTPHGNYILYNSPATGIDNIFAIDLRNGARFQLTSSRYGAYNPSVSADGKTLYYNDQSADGLDVASIPFEPQNWKPFTPQPVHSAAEVLAQQEGHEHLLDSVPNRNYPVKKYSRFRGLVNPYAWGPLATSTLAQASFGVHSQDLLSTTSVFAGLNYDVYAKTAGWGATLTYAGLYPIFDLSYNYTHRQTSDTWKTRRGDNTVYLDWNESVTSVGARVPWTLTSSRFHTYLTLGNKISIIKTSSFSNEVKNEAGRTVSKRNGRLAEIEPGFLYSYNDKVNENTPLYTNAASLAFSRTLKTSYRDFLYRWGQALNLEYYNTFESDYQGQQLAVRAAFYFPGLAKHHYLYGRANYQESFNSYQFNTYTFANHIFRPRGYAYPRDSEFYALSANYALPLWYPDIHAGPLLNIQRVKANFFLDYGKGSGSVYYYRVDRSTQRVTVYASDANAAYLSYGTEITFDVNVLRFLPQLDLGFRITNRQANPFNAGGTAVEFLINSIGF